MQCGVWSISTSQSSGLLIVSVPMFIGLSDYKQWSGAGRFFFWKSWKIKTLLRLQLRLIEKRLRTSNP